MSFKSALEKVVVSLPGANLISLIEQLPAMNNFMSEILVDIVGDKQALFGLLLQQERLGNDRLKPLRAMSGELWAGSVGLAINASFGDEEIHTYSITSILRTWSGKESEYYLRLQSQYSIGLRSENPRISAIARRCNEHFQK